MYRLGGACAEVGSNDTIGDANWIEVRYDDTGVCPGLDGEGFVESGSPEVLNCGAGEVFVDDIRAVKPEAATQWR